MYHWTRCFLASNRSAGQKLTFKFLEHTDLYRTTIEYEPKGKCRATEEMA
jgi:hypothetical protein